MTESKKNLLAIRMSLREFVFPQRPRLCVHRPEDGGRLLIRSRFVLIQLTQGFGVSNPGKVVPPTKPELSREREPVCVSFVQFFQVCRCGFWQRHPLFGRVLAPHSAHEMACRLTWLVWRVLECQHVWLFT